MTLNINFFFTSPVEAVRVTPKNMEEVAAWCGGRVSSVESRKVKGRMDSYVWVPTPDGSKISWAFAGMWITKRLAITENNEIKETYSVFRKDYFSKNYFEDPSIALEDTWGRAQKEREHKARQARTITLELPEGADIEAVKGQILENFINRSADGLTHNPIVEDHSVPGHKHNIPTGPEIEEEILSPVEQRQLIIEDAVEAEALDDKEEAIALERKSDNTVDLGTGETSHTPATDIAFSNDPRLT